MKRTIFEESGVVDGTTSIETFVRALFPYFELYGLRPAETPFDICRDYIFGDPGGARIEYRYFGGFVDPYVGGSLSESLKSFQLVNRETQSPSEIEIMIEDVAWSHTELALKFEGEEKEVEILREAVRPFLKKCLWKYKNSV